MTLGLPASVSTHTPCPHPTPVPRAWNTNLSSSSFWPRLWPGCAWHLLLSPQETSRGEGRGEAAGGASLSASLSISHLSTPLSWRAPGCQCKRGFLAALLAGWSQISVPHVRERNMKREVCRGQAGVSSLQPHVQSQDRQGPPLHTLTPGSHLPCGSTQLSLLGSSSNI